MVNMEKYRSFSTTAWENFEFPYKKKDEAHAARKVFHKLSRSVPESFVLDLDDYWSSFCTQIPCSIRQLPKFFIKALCSQNMRERDIITLAAFAYSNDINADLLTDILRLKSTTAEEQFISCFSDFNDLALGDFVRNITITYNIEMGHRVNLNNEPAWLVNLDRDKENIPPNN